MTPIVDTVNVLLIHAALTRLLNVVCNGVMTDSQLIEELGGPTKLARELGYGQGGPQRVSNWKSRGIPAEVKLERPDLFLRHLQGAAPAAGNVPEPAHAR